MRRCFHWNTEISQLLGYNFFPNSFSVCSIQFTHSRPPPTPILQPPSLPSLSSLPVLQRLFNLNSFHFFFHYVLLDPARKKKKKMIVSLDSFIREPLQAAFYHVHSDILQILSFWFRQYKGFVSAKIPVDHPAPSGSFFIFVL